MEPKPWDVGKFLQGFMRRPDPDIRIFVLYGPDGGLVRERSAAIAKKILGDGAEDHQIVRLDGATLGEDPARVADEAAQVGMFGGERVIRIVDGGQAAAATAVLNYFENPVGSVVIVEAGDLKPANALRKQLGAPKVASAVVLPCYPDEGEALERVIDSVLAEEKFAIDPDARALLAGMLGPDRGQNRRMVEVLALYKGEPGQTITVADVGAALGDNAAVGFDAVAFACLGGRPAEALQLFDKSIAEKIDPSQISASLLRQFDQIDALDAAMAGGKSMDIALKTLRLGPRARQMAFRRIADLWPGSRRARGRELVIDTDLRSRSGFGATGGDGGTLLYRDLLLRLSQAAASAARGPAPRY